MVDIYLKRQYKINHLSSTGIRCKEVYRHEIPGGGETPHIKWGGDARRLT